MQYLSNYVPRPKSVITGQENLEHLHTFKNFPVFFGCTNESAGDDLYADMIWKIDPLTGFIQLSDLVPLEILYMAQHVDATGLTWANYNNAFADYLLANRVGDITEIGGGSGKLANIILNKAPDINYTVVEPNPIFEESENLKIVKSFFSAKLRDQLKSDNTITFSQVYEHVYNPEEFLTEISDFLPVGGRLIFAYPNLEYWFSNKFTNAINFEHTMLMTDYFVDYFLRKTGFNILEKIEYENHSHFYTVEKSASRDTFSNGELESKYSHYKGMFNDYITYHDKLVNELNEMIADCDGEVFLFGAHIFAQYLLAFGLNTARITYILDNSPLKQEKRLYGSNLMVKSPKILAHVKNPVVILRAGLYNKEIMDDILTNINPHTKFI